MLHSINRRLCFGVILIFVVSLIITTKTIAAASEKSSGQKTDTQSLTIGNIVVHKESSDSSKSDDLPQFSKIAKDATPISGLLNFYRDKQDLYFEVTSSNLNEDYIIVISIARGIGQYPLLAGWSWNYGDDMIWQFRKVNDRIQIVRRNFRHQANSGTPEAKALAITFSDSIIYSLPIVAKGPNGGDMIELTSIFMSDLPGISSLALPGFSFARDRSTWAKIKGLKDNMELEVAATYSGYGSGSSNFGDDKTSNSTNAMGSSLNELIMDPRGLTVNVHYSISKLRDTGYKPRLSDERVGYFNTVIKNYSKNEEENNFVRYINRWNLKKMDESAETSLVEKPVIFWLEKTIPVQYRKPIRDGILEWNKAFEKAGYYNALEVRQQEENDTWDPEDINYNTIRWSNAHVGFAIGPSRVNPLTGEILDADVILDIGFIKHWHQEFDIYSPKDLLQQMVGLFGFSSERKNQKQMSSLLTENLSENQRASAPQWNDSFFYSQQMGVAMTFFDVMTDEDLYAPDETLLKKAPGKNQVKADKKTDSNEKKSDGKKSDGKKAKAKSDAKDKKYKDEKVASSDSVKKDGKKSDKKSKKVVAEKAKDKKASDKDNVKKDNAKKEVAKKDGVKKDDATSKAKREADLKAKRETARKKLIVQGLSHLTTHEVGHTLGLRHNFKQSTAMTLEELNKLPANAEYGYSNSVMDYVPTNLMPKGMKQGDYYPTKLGKYDYWVILYGYKDFGKSTESELSDLKAIASQQSKPEYNYATDEDYRSETVDPLVNLYDLGKDPLEYAKLRVKLADQIFKGLNDRVVKKGESYDKLVSRFNALLGDKIQAASFALRYIGGTHVNRDFKGDPNGRPTFVPVDSKEQRAALAFLTKEVFGPDDFRIPSDLYNYLAPNRWRHWGSRIPARYDLDIHELILTCQTWILNSLFDSNRLSHLNDASFRVPEKSRAKIFTSAEMVDSLTTAIFAELDKIDEGTYSEQKPAISSTRRNLQRTYVKTLTNTLSGGSGSALLALFGLPGGSSSSDFSNIIRVKLAELKDQIDSALDGNADLDIYSKAHLQDLQEEIDSTFKAVKTKR